MIRQATAADIPALVALSIEALSIDRYEQLVVDEGRVFAEVNDCVTDYSNFAWVSEDESGIQGAIGAIVVPLAVYQRNQCQIVMWYCKTPGEGAKLLRQFMRWLKSRPMIKQCTYIAERKGDPRIGRLLTRVGFEPLPMYVLTR